MSDINIRRQHGKTRAEARASAEHLAGELQQEFGLDCLWTDDTLRFQRPGVSGELVLDEQAVELSIRLGFFLAALKPSIEKEVNRFFDENFAA